MTLIMSGVLTGCGLFGLKTGLRSLGERVNEAARDTVEDRSDNSLECSAGKGVMEGEHHFTGVLGQRNELPASF